MHNISEAPNLVYPLNQAILSQWVPYNSNLLRDAPQLVQENYYWKIKN
jgi:hypothetical protein